MDSGLMFLFVPEMLAGGFVVSFLFHLVLNRRSFVALAVSAAMPFARQLIPALFDNEAPPIDATIAYSLAVISGLGFLIALLGALLGCWSALKVRRFFHDPGSS